MRIRTTTTPIPCQSFIVGDVLGLPETPEQRCKNFAQHALGSDESELAFCLPCAQKVAERDDEIGVQFKAFVARMEQVSSDT